MPQHILATGAAGMLGSHFDDPRIVKTDVDRLDVRDLDQVRSAIARVEPDLVLHLAAETDVDRCEREPDHAYRTNAIGTENVVLACQERDLELVYISTAGVFRGDKHEPYTEMDVPDPANVYGQTKLEGEKIVQALLRRYYIVRAGWMFGGFERDKKFVGKIIRLLAERDHLDVVNDKVGSPTYAGDLASGILQLVETRRYGLYHMTNVGVASRYDVAVALRRLTGRDVPINAISSAAFPLSAPRARSEAMRNYRLDMLGINPMRRWEAALEDYVGRLLERERVRA